MKNGLLALTCLLASHTTAAAGAWSMTFPVDGFGCKSASAVEEALKKHFQQLKDDQGRPLLINIRADSETGIVEIYMDCPAQGVAHAELVKAFAGTAFSVPLRDWHIKNNIGFLWRTEKEISAAEIKKLEETYRMTGTGCTAARIDARAVERGFEYCLVLTFKQEGEASADKIVSDLKVQGYAAGLVFIKGDRSGAVVTRAKRP